MQKYNLNGLFFKRSGKTISVRLCTYWITMVSIIVQITYRGLVFGHKGEERDSVKMVREGRKKRIEFYA